MDPRKSIVWTATPPGTVPRIDVGCMKLTMRYSVIRLSVWLNGFWG